ncbi:MAG: hypothetical protein EWV49_19095 [Microcystis aeruginosa Ma_QC_Ch_20071001_S25]|uniref:Uncharacterized protein n=1 Tax=Microcystis aeruginosa Ma_QC_Ch_20071001_S25D TaxID=2486250 RepID=A0A552FZY0_MICAE|nr:MAG: hypothetical protein EWV49_19095 [Microcystis aeruginosa Ma_QC_Ch_20071001_S25]TRU52293.1 MAG: hypothetical protein EWV57_05805 [Microcystis aeruginosa Ma_QC_Ch_20071001_S25D]TRU61766.1 MAG: hypothetical protein EWV90_12090 [Microcystis aeruginosa Ma_QC_Ch_20071001_M135]
MDCPSSFPENFRYRCRYPSPFDHWFTHQRYSLINQLSVISYQLSVISYQLSVISYQFTVYCLLKKSFPLPHFPTPHHPTL